MSSLLQILSSARWTILSTIETRFITDTINVIRITIFLLTIITIFTESSCNHFHINTAHVHQTIKNMISPCSLKILLLLVITLVPAAVVYTLDLVSIKTFIPLEPFSSYSMSKTSHPISVWVPGSQSTGLKNH